MASLGAQFPVCASNNDLLVAIDDLRGKRDHYDMVIAKTEDEIVLTQKELELLMQKVGKLQEELQYNIKARNNYHKSLVETEAAYAKVAESMNTLANVVTREKDALDVTDHRQHVGADYVPGYVVGGQTLTSSAVTSKVASKAPRSAISAQEHVVDNLAATRVAGNLLDVRGTLGTQDALQGVSFDVAPRVGARGYSLVRSAAHGDSCASYMGRGTGLSGNATAQVQPSAPAQYMAQTRTTGTVTFSC